MITKDLAEKIKYEVASDLVREYRRAEGDNALLLTQGMWRQDYLIGWRDAVRSCATRMGVYEQFTELLDAYDVPIGLAIEDLKKLTPKELNKLALASGMPDGYMSFKLTDAEYVELVYTFYKSHLKHNGL